MTRYRIRTRPTLETVGERRVAKPGRGMEFHELRSYAQGDEPRFIDWRAFARTGRLYTRLFQAEVPARFYFFLDGSPSMKLLGKDTYAERVFQTLSSFSKSEGAYQWGGGKLRSLALPQPNPAGPSSLLAHPRPKGVSVVVTDGLDNLDWSRLLKRLRRVVLVQVLAPQELSPDWQEGFLEDVELRERLEVGPREVEEYKTALEAHILRLKTVSRRLGAYALLRVGEPIVPGLLRQGVLEER